MWCPLRRKSEKKLNLTFFSRFGTTRKQNQDLNSHYKTFIKLFLFLFLNYHSNTKSILDIINAGLINLNHSFPDAFGNGIS